MKNIKLTVNGVPVETTEGKTILDAVHENKIDNIPNLCFDNRFEPCTSCFLCVVEVKGINRLLPSCSTKATDGMVVLTNTPEIRESRKTALELIMSNHYADCVGPCKNNCPAGVDVQSYIALISMQKYEEALKLIKENNPLPLSVCRVCVRDCEVACRRNYVDEPVAVNKLKRFVADLDSPHKWTPEIQNRNGKRVAVIGSGPAGLTAAYYLNNAGFDLTIFEKFDKPGGMLRYGIPEYRLPKQILDDEINWILSLGVKLETNKSLGRDFSIDDLFDTGYESIFIAPGAHKGSRLGLAGEEDVKEIVSGIEFLRDVTNGRTDQLKGNIIVVGGGNTAIDAARTALRCGAASVKIVYRRSIKEMPAHHEEIEAAQKEGIEIVFLTNPKSLVVKNGRLTGIDCLKMALEAGKPGERPRPVAVQGSEFIINCDYIISAIGQSLDTSFTERSNAISLNKWGNIVAEENSLATTVPGVFAGGDAVTGPLTAISAIAQGKKAAGSIIHYLMPGSNGVNNYRYYSLKHKLAEVSEREFDSQKKLSRAQSDELDIEERIHNFCEVEFGLTENQSLEETSRCLECGCSEYADCRLRKYCDEYRVDTTNYLGEIRKYKIDSRHPFIALDPNKCINCGKCIKACGEALKVSALGFVYRGFKSIMKPAMEKALSETDCISCGNCIDVCPTGAISEKFPFKILGTLPKEDIKTVCAFCSVGCEVNYKKISDDIFYVSNSDEPSHANHNNGFLCSKGKFGHRYLLQKNRVFDPVIKREGHYETVNIGEAISFIESRIIDIVGKYGNGSVAVMASPKLSNEELYLLQKFTRAGLLNNNIDSFTRLMYGEEQNALDTQLGFTASTTGFNSIEKADVIVLINTNLPENNLVMELKIKSAQKKGTKVITFNSSETRMGRYTDLWIDNKKGTTTALLDLIIKECVDYPVYNNNKNPDVINNFTGLAQRLSCLDQEQILGMSGIDKSKFASLAGYLTNPDLNIVFLYDLDYKTEKSANDLSAIGNYLLVTGRAGKPDNGLILLRGLNNSAGSYYMGAVPDYLPGYATNGNQDAIETIGKMWNTNLNSIFKPVDLLHKLAAGEIKALLIFGEDPLLDWSNKKYFSDVEFIVAADSFWNTTMAEADAVLPLSTHIEQEGTYTRCDNITQESKRVVTPVNPFSNTELIAMLASKFADGFEYKSRQEILSEIKSVNRMAQYNSNSKSCIENYFQRGFGYKNASFCLYDAGFSVFEPFTPAIHYPENYYITNVKNKFI